MIVLRLDPLPQHHLDPGIHAEELIIVVPDVSPLPKGFDTVRERVRHLQVTVFAPELAVFSLVHVVVQDAEVANLLDLSTRFLVIAIDERLRDATEWEEANEPARARDDEMDAGGFQRLDEAARQAECDDILVPDLASAAGCEFDDPRLVQCLPIDCIAQLFYCLFV